MTRTRSTVLGFGDSLTAGTPGYDPEYGGDVRYQYGHWLAELARTDEHEVEFVNRGVPGDLAATMPSRLENEMTRGRYDCVIILAGTNDLGWGALPEEVLRRLSVLWDIVAAHDVPLVTCTLPPVGFLDPGLQDHRARVNRGVLAAPLARNRCVAVDIFSHLADADGLLVETYDSGDGLHLSIEGYRVLGETLWREGVRRIL